MSGLKDSAIELHLGRSVIWFRLTLSAHALAALAPLFSAAGLFAVLVWPFIGLSFFYLMRRDYLRNLACSVKGLRLYQGEWTLQGASGQWFDSELKGERLITPFLTALSFQAVKEGKARRYRAVIFRDAVAPEPYRRLRVYLLLGE